MPPVSGHSALRQPLRGSGARECQPKAAKDIDPRKTDSVGDQDLFSDLTRIEQGLVERFPGLTGIAPLKRLDSGVSSLVVESSSGIVFRLGKNEAVAASYDREAQVLFRVRPYLDLPVPNPKWRAPPSRQALYGVFGYPKLAGVPLHRGHLETLDWHRIADDIAGFLRQLHNSPVEQFVDLDLPVFHSRPEALIQMQPHVLPHLETALSSDEYCKARRWWDAFLADERMQDYEPVLIHGDPFYANILLDEATSKVTAVIDFENATLGDPAQDLAVQHHLGQEFAEAVMAAYTQAGCGCDGLFEHRVRQLWIFREFAGLMSFLQTDNESEAAECVWKLRNGPLFRGAA